MNAAIQPLTTAEVEQFFADWTFIASVGDYTTKQACAMSAAVAITRVRRGVDMNGATDQLECVDPVIRKLVISRNDATPEADRKAWAISMVPRFVGTNGGKALAVKRAEHIARYCVRVVAAEAMDSAKLPETAKNLRALAADAPMSDCRAVASEARDSARKALDKRYAAADAAAVYAAATAADAADAAAYYAAVYAAAAADAAEAAAYYAADYAAAADAAARLTAVRLAHLDRMIEDCLAITE